MDNNVPEKRFIKAVVKDRSFIDVGGLFGTVNERVSVAHAAGASKLTMLDACSADYELWRKFRARMDTLEVKNYYEVVHDISEVSDICADVVNCGGVIYHHPNPMQILTNLRKMTTKHLILTSIVLPRLTFVPALQPDERQLLSEHFKPVLQGNRLIGITEQSDFQLTDYAPCWWIPDRNTLVGMLRCAGFAIMAEEKTWDGNALALLMC